MSVLTYDICLVYLDNILVFSKTFDEHCDRLATIFDRLERYTLKQKPIKCHLFQRNVTFLGHVITVAGTAPRGIGSYPSPQMNSKQNAVMTPASTPHPVTGSLMLMSRHHLFLRRWQPTWLLRRFPHFCTRSPQLSHSTQRPLRSVGRSALWPWWS